MVASYPWTVEERFESYILYYDLDLKLMCSNFHYLCDMEKVCVKCEQSKEIELFQKRSKNKDGYTNICKECKRIYDNEYHKNRSDESKLRKYSLQQQRRILIRNWILLFLEDKSCIECGEDDKIVLEFHHKYDKSFNISDGISKAYSINKLEEELSKCDILCANCHRRVTAKEYNYYRIIV